MVWKTVLVILMVALAGCTTTEQAPAGSVARSGFLGDYSKLRAGEKDQASLRYINAGARWTRYKKILLEPVTFWGGDKSDVPPSEQQALCTFFYDTLRAELEKKFQLVDEAGPDVMRMQVALTDATSATPGLRTMSIAIPQARTLNTLQAAATGTYAFVGGAQAEARLTDAASGDVLGMWVDKRIGGGSLKTAMQWKWGDAENAMKDWAVKSAETLSGWTSGSVKPN